MKKKSSRLLGLDGCNWFEDNLEKGTSILIGSKKWTLLIVNLLSQK